MVLPRFLAELKHRNVYRAAVVYAAVGWALLEMADVVLPRLDLPDWTVNVVLAVVLLGFPLALVFAWIFDFNAQGIVRTEPISPDAHHRFSFVRIAEFVLIFVLVATVGYLYVERLTLQKRLAEPEIANLKTSVTPNPEHYRAIAVLPFADMSEAGDQAWLAEGIAEELLHGLARVDELRVMARTSSFAFKGTDKTIAEIADILGVQAVLEGSVRRSGDRLKITAQLVDASSGYHIWSGSYQRELKDIFQLQDELAKSIVKTLRVQLGVGPSDRLIATQTENLEAFEWFLQGRALVNWGNPDRVFQSVINLEKAVELDPNYADAWGYLSFARFTTVLYRSFDEVSPSIVSAYERALLLNPEQSMALAVKALITQISSYNYEEAGRLYKQSIASRADALAIAAYSFWYLVAIDQGELAIKLMSEAERLDPLHSGLKNNFTMLLRVMGRTEDAVLKVEEVLQVDPRHEIAAMNLIELYAETGRFTEVERILDNMPPALLDRPRTKLHIGLYNAERGNEQEARDIYTQLLNDSHDYPFPFFARLALKLGEVEQAIDLMEKEIENKAFTLFWIRPLFRDEEALRNHPRYLALLKRIGLDDESVKLLNARVSFDYADDAGQIPGDPVSKETISADGRYPL